MMSEDKNRYENVPKSAFILYTKLFCKRKTQSDIGHGNLMEATKSWLSLSKTEKQYFIEKHQEYNNKYKQLFAKYLRNAKPYMKKKSTAIVINEQCNENSLNESPTNISDAIDTDGFNPSITEDCFQREASPEPTLINEEPKDIVQNTENTILAEPSPPKVRTSRELFELIKSGNPDISDLTWHTLSTSEKQPYQKAILSIKKDYLVKYKAYLQSLPSDKLFDHYHRVI